MIACPKCGADITRTVRRAAKERARLTGAKGGSATGEAKRRNVDYVELARKSHEARRENSK